MHEVAGENAVTRREHAIVGRRRTATLDVAQHGHARLEASLLADTFRQRMADPAQQGMAELVGPRGAAALEAVDAGALGNHDDAVVPARAGALDQ